MLPNNAISAVPKYAIYQAPDAQDGQEVQSLELGGVALNDATQGRRVRTWKAWIDDKTIKIAPFVEMAPVTTLVTVAGTLTSVSLAFDASMAPTICYFEDDLLKLRWYNTVTASFQTDSFSGATSARVSTDDKRSSREGQSDVIFAYVRAGTLYYRQQRDRYLIERVVGAAVKRKLTRLGLTQNYRLQFELSPE